MIKIKGAMLIRLMQMIFWTFNNTSVLKWKANKQNWPISVSSFHLFSYSLIQFRVLMFSIPFHVSCVHVSVLMPFWLLPISHLCLMISHSCVCIYRNVFPFVLCLQSAELLCFCSFVCASPWWILSSFCFELLFHVQLWTLLKFWLLQHQNEGLTFCSLCLHPSRACRATPA